MSVLVASHLAVQEGPTSTPCPAAEAVGSTTRAPGDLQTHLLQRPDLLQQGLGEWHVFGVCVGCFCFTGYLGGHGVLQVCHGPGSLLAFLWPWLPFPLAVPAAAQSSGTAFCDGTVMPPKTCRNRYNSCVREQAALLSPCPWGSGANLWQALLCRARLVLWLCKCCFLTDTARKHNYVYFWAQPGCLSSRGEAAVGDTGECPVLLAGPGVGWRLRSALTQAWHSRQGLARDLPNLFLGFGRIRTAAHLFLLTLI